MSKYKFCPSCFADDGSLAYSVAVSWFQIWKAGRLAPAVEDIWQLLFDEIAATSIVSQH